MTDRHNLLERLDRLEVVLTKLIASTANGYGSPISTDDAIEWNELILEARAKAGITENEAKE